MLLICIPYKNYLNIVDTLYKDYLNVVGTPL